MHLHLHLHRIPVRGAMVPSIDLNLVHQPDDNNEDSRLEAPEENAMPEQNVNPEQTPVTSPKSTGDDKGVIPFRTSLRLQGVIMHRITQQRDGNSQENDVPITKSRNSGAPPLPSRKVKKQQRESPSPEGVDHVKCKTADTTSPSVDILKDIGCDIVKNTVSGNRKRKSFTVHFADPLVAYIGDETAAAGMQLLSLSQRDSLRARQKVPSEPKRSARKRSTHADGNKQQPWSPPLSCFDLLCNHVGPRGWRCYRSRVEGKSFCGFHANRKTLPFESGISQTVRN